MEYLFESYLILAYRGFLILILIVFLIDIMLVQSGYYIEVIDCLS